jgi:dihydropteroate synthase
LNSNFEIMGIVNLTPDSFSDGGKFYFPKDAINHVHKLLEFGTDYIDLGAESTRPGAKKVSEADEWARLEPIFKELSKLDLKHTKISLDSKNSSTIIKACATGVVSMINDVSGVQDLDTLIECRESANAKGIKLKYCAMHMHLDPSNMQNSPLKGEEAVAECETFFHLAFERLLEAGFCKEDIYLDPGVGFGKDDKANLLLINEASNWSKRFNLLYGISRKSFLGRILDIENPVERDHPSKSLELSLAMMGTKIIRTHDANGLLKIREVFR